MSFFFKLPLISWVQLSHFLKSNLTLWAEIKQNLHPVIIKLIVHKHELGHKVIKNVIYYILKVLCAVLKIDLYKDLLWNKKRLTKSIILFSCKRLSLIYRITFSVLILFLHVPHTGMQTIKSY